MTDTPIHLCIVNRNYPPDDGATGFHASQLATYLRDHHGYVVSIVTTSIDHQSEEDIYRVGRNYNGKNKIARLTAGSLECRTLLKKALRISADFYIVMTDPPQLNYWASRMLKGKKWALWTMDLYPQGYVANGLIGEHHPLTKHYITILQKTTPDFLITLGQNQRNALRYIYKNDIQSVSLPIGIINSFANKNSLPSWYEKGRLHIAYVGNLGEAHDVDHIYKVATTIDASKYKFIISCSGAKAKEAYQKLEKLNHVTILEYIPNDEMSFIDIQVVLLSSQWTHICVPSKAITAVQHGSAILFLGDEESDTWAYVNTCGWRPSIKSLDSFFSNLSHDHVRQKREKTNGLIELLKSELTIGWDRIANLISRSIKD